MTEALATAFATSSSTATTPVTIRCSEDYMGVDKRFASTLLLIGATVNMHGSAIYYAITALFFAQVCLYKYLMLLKFEIIDLVKFDSTIKSLKMGTIIVLYYILSIY